MDKVKTAEKFINTLLPAKESKRKYSSNEEPIYIIIWLFLIIPFPKS